MSDVARISSLCREALEEESNWREAGPEGRKATYERFQQLVREIAELTGRTYEDVMNDAVEEWVIEHFCSTEQGRPPSPEWREAEAGRAAEA